MKPDLLIIFESVSIVSGIPISAIRGRRRTRIASRARFVVVFLVRCRFPWWSQAKLSEVVGRLDHGSAAHALHRAESLNESDPAFADLLARSATLASVGSATLATLDPNRQSLLNQ